METADRLILASGSSGRRWLMNQAGFVFDVIPSSIEEPISGFTNPRVMVQTIAWMKAHAVAMARPNGNIISADTIAWIDGEPLLKPNGRDHARTMIKMLQGRIHELWTGVVVWTGSRNDQICWQERSLVRVAPMDPIQIERYLNEREWVGCSGSYAIRGGGDPVIQALEGSVSNIVGLPMESLSRVLGSMGYKPGESMERF